MRGPDERQFVGSREVKDLLFRVSPWKRIQTVFIAVINTERVKSNQTHTPDSLTAPAGRNIAKPA